MIELKRGKALTTLLNCVFALILCCFVLPSPSLAGQTPRASGKPDPIQTASIIGVRPQVERLVELRHNPDANREELILLRAALLRKILRGVLEVRQYCNRLDLERAYTYDIMQKEERRQAFVNQLFTVANFAQLSTFYTLEPFVRIHKQFATSAIFTTVSGSLGTSVSTFSRLHGTLAKASNVAPRAVLGDLVEGGPVDGSAMPPLVSSYFDSKPEGSDKTRREELFAFWLRHYRIDASSKENLCALSDKKKAGLNLLRSRILLLWSLNSSVQDFDRELLALLKFIEMPVQSSIAPISSDSKAVDSPALRGGSSEIAEALKLGPYVNELKQLKESGRHSERINQLELQILEKVLEGSLEVQVAADKVDEDLYYNYHIILADLLSTRAKWLQLNYDANFLQSGILGIVAGRLYLSRLAFAGDQMFVISGSNGTALTTLAMLQMRGFWRKVDTGPNSLAEVLGLQPRDEYLFSPFVSRLLNSPPPGSTDGKSRRELLNDVWRQKHIATVNLDSPKTRQALSAMPSHKLDTIKVVKNRIALLHSLKKDIESFQVDMLEILKITE